MKRNVFSRKKHEYEIIKDKPIEDATVPSKITVLLPRLVMPKYDKNSTMKDDSEESVIQEL